MLLKDSTLVGLLCIAWPWGAKGEFPLLPARGDDLIFVGGGLFLGVKGLC